MASVLLSSVGVGQQYFDNNGVPLAGGLIYTYQAGSSTPLATYQDNAGTIANANPIVLDSAGRVPNEIWLLQGYSYKFIIQNASGTSLITLDNLYGILQNAPAQSGTIPSGLIAIWSGSTGSIPSGWLLCNGASVSSSTYPGLYAAIGHTYGGSGSSFNLPDARNKMVIGAGSSYGLGNTGGSSTSSLSISNMPSHNHSVNINHGHSFTQGSHHHSMSGLSHSHTMSGGTHAHGADPSTNYGSFWGNGTGHSYVVGTSGVVGGIDAGRMTATGDGTPVGMVAASGLTGTYNTGSNITDTSSSVNDLTTSGAVATSAIGGGSAFSTISPYIALNKIIKT